MRNLIRLKWSTNNMMRNLSKFLILVLFLAAPAFAAKDGKDTKEGPVLKDGAGSSGGGQSRNGQLRDLVEPGITEESIGGNEFVSRFDAFQRMQKLFEKIYYPMAEKIQIELNSTTFYLVDAPFAELPHDEQNGLVKSEEKWAQSAVWIHKESGKNEVYISLSEYKLMNDENRSMLVLHELLHGISNEKVYKLKIMKIRSFVRYVYNELKLGNDFNRVELQQKIKNTDLGIPTPEDSISARTELSNFRDESIMDTLLSQVGTRDEQLKILNDVVYFTSCNEHWENTKALEWALKNGGNPNTVYKYSERHEAFDFSSRITAMFRYPLLCAATYGKSEIVKILINNGADVTLTASKDKLNALYLASGEKYAKDGHPEIVKLLLETGKMSKDDQRPYIAVKQIVDTNYDSKNNQKIMAMLKEYYGIWF